MSFKKVPAVAPVGEFKAPKSDYVVRMVEHNRQFTAYEKGPAPPFDLIINPKSFPG